MAEDAVTSELPLWLNSLLTGKNTGILRIRSPILAAKSQPARRLARKTEFCGQSEQGSIREATGDVNSLLRSFGDLRAIVPGIFDRLASPTRNMANNSAG